ncbi:hypothetical protein GF340_01715 [Candidatus Peregrinibacteria bacterium]|nr:hypothetical protein [Candidatus Peregrinibacteria bacterium]
MDVQISKNKVSRSLTVTIIDIPKRFFGKTIYFKLGSVVNYKGRRDKPFGDFFNKKIVFSAVTHSFQIPSETMEGVYDYESPCVKMYLQAEMRKKGLLAILPIFKREMPGVLKKYEINNPPYDAKLDIINVRDEYKKTPGSMIACIVPIALIVAIVFGLTMLALNLNEHEEEVRGYLVANENAIRSVLEPMFNTLGPNSLYAIVAVIITAIIGVFVFIAIKTWFKMYKKSKSATNVEFKFNSNQLEIDKEYHLNDFLRASFNDELENVVVRIVAYNMENSFYVHRSQRRSYTKFVKDVVKYHILFEKKLGNVKVGDSTFGFNSEIINLNGIKDLLPQYMPHRFAGITTHLKLMVISKSHVDHAKVISGLKIV